MHNPHQAVTALEFSGLDPVTGEGEWMHKWNAKWIKKTTTRCLCCTGIRGRKKGSEARNVWSKRVVTLNKQIWHQINDRLEWALIEKRRLQCRLRCTVVFVSVNSSSACQQTVIPTHALCLLWFLAIYPLVFFWPACTAPSCGGSRLSRAAPATSSKLLWGGSRGVSRPAGISNPSSAFWVLTQSTPTIPSSLLPPLVGVLIKCRHQLDCVVSVKRRLLFFVSPRSHSQNSAVKTHTDNGLLCTTARTTDIIFSLANRVCQSHGKKKKIPTFLWANISIHTGDSLLFRVLFCNSAIVTAPLSTFGYL